MLLQLIIRDLGLIEEAELNLGKGLQVITGETGVGKSMLLSSIGILRGERARTDMIRKGADQALVSGFFHLPSSDFVEQLQQESGLELPDGEVLLERRLRRSGRHQALVNGREVPLSVFRRLGPLLLEVQSQRSQLALLDPARQLFFIDQYAKVAKERDQFSDDYREARKLAKQIDTLKLDSKERNDRKLFVEHLVDELVEADLKAGEKEELDKELELLEESDRIQLLVESCVAHYYENENSLLDRMSKDASDIAAFAELHSGLKEFAESLEQAQSLLHDGVRSLQVVQEDLERDPARLEEARSRIDLLLRLEERHRRPTAELVVLLEEMQEELLQMTNLDQDLPLLEQELLAALESLGKKARAIGRKRRTAAKKLSELIRAELVDLQLPHAAFEAQLRRLKASEGWQSLQENGADQAEFMFGPNPGEGMSPLRETASGGELSRVMLALRCVLAGADPVSLVVFDEIDSGVGGRLGAQLGQKLQQIGQAHQVLAVTHMPQIACYGSRHFAVRKEVESGRTRTYVEVLDAKQRVEEVAAMIRGDGRTVTSLKEAKEMISEANCETSS